MADFATREDLREMSRDIVAQINRRFDDARTIGDQRHSENIDRMEFIAAQVTRTNGRVTVLEQIVKTLQDEFLSIRKRWHDFRDSLQTDLARAVVPKSVTGEDRPFTQREFLYVLGLIITTAAITVGITWFVQTHGVPS